MINRDADYIGKRNLLFTQYICFRVDDGVDCNLLPRKKDGNTTTWGCSVALTQNDCSYNSRWWTACCIWSNETCISKDFGKHSAKLKLCELFISL